MTELVLKSKQQEHEKKKIQIKLLDCIKKLVLKKKKKNSTDWKVEVFKIKSMEREGTKENP